MARLIQVANLPDSFDSLLLQRLFEAHGAVRSATINSHLESGCSTGVGFVEMESEEGGAAAIAALHHREHGGSTLSVCWTGTPKPPVADHEQMFGPMNMTGDGVK